MWHLTLNYSRLSTDCELDLPRSEQMSTLDISVPAETLADKYTSCRRGRGWEDDDNVFIFGLVLEYFLGQIPGR